MAVESNELHSVVSTTANSNRRYAPLMIKPMIVGAGATAITPFQPLSYNTSTTQVEPFVNGGANGTGTIIGLAPPEGITRHATNQVLANVVLAANIHFDEIPIAVYSSAQLKAAIIASGLLARGFNIDGFPDFR